jgi:DNA-binding NarL/FixJ family response regulator
MTIRVVIVDDHPVVRDGVRMLLDSQPDIEVVATASNGLEAVEQVRAWKPEVVLMDLVMPEMDGVAAIRRIKAELPEVRILVLTTYDDDEKIFEGLKAGAEGYLLKDVPTGQLAEAVRTVSRGESLLEPVVAAKLLGQFRELAQRDTAAEDINALTERELEVLQLLAEGETNKGIAERLVITEKTVKTHVTHIYNKLGANNRAEAVAIAFARGLLET